MRVYELAREFKIKSKDFMKLLEKEFGLSYSSHMSSIQDQDVERIRAGLDEDKQKNRPPADKPILIKREDRTDISEEKKEKIRAKSNRLDGKPADADRVIPESEQEKDRKEKEKQAADQARKAKLAEERKAKEEERKALEAEKKRKAKEAAERKKARQAEEERQAKEAAEKRRAEEAERQKKAKEAREREKAKQAQEKKEKARKEKAERDRARQAEEEKKAKKAKKKEEARKKKKRNKKKKEEEPGLGDELEKPKRGKKRKKRKKTNKKKKQEEAQEPEVEDDFTDIIEIPEEITVGDFAKAINQNAMDVIGELIKMGIMTGLNETINFETAEDVAEKFGILITEPEKKTGDEIFDQLDFEDKEEDLQPRPPVVTVMGHVDHGKTTLLDAIRRTNVTEGEAGGITQHIGASEIKLGDRKITFLDTPGHEAFTSMRAHGASTTDIVILVVAADDGVMPQTVEAINHAKAADVPIIVAINKMDKYGADPNRVMQELMEYELVPEEWGGSTIMMPISAKTGEGVQDLLEMVLMVADLAELKANPNRPAIGVVIESQLETGRGATATVLVQKGTLHDTDYVVSGLVSGHIRAMYNAKGEELKEAGPSSAAKIVGLSDLPESGDHIYAVNDEKIARDLAAKAQERERKNRLNKTTHVSLEELHNQISEDGIKELNIIVKTDVKGTIDALASSLENMGNDEVQVNIIHGSVGGISESDVMLAAASNAIIIGFNVRPNQGALAQAERENIDIRTYRVIYEAIDDIQAAIKGMLEPTIKEEVLGHAQVRQTFKVSKVGTVAGIYVDRGKMSRKAMARLVRDNVVIYEGNIASLKRYTDDVKEVAQGYEAGLGIENYNDIKVGDEIECFQEVEVKAE